MFAWLIGIVVLLLFALLCILLASYHQIGPAQIGLVHKRVGKTGLSNGDPLAFAGEPGWQAELRT